MSAHRIVLATLLTAAFALVAACGEGEEDAGTPASPTGTALPTDTPAPTEAISPTPEPHQLDTYVSPGGEFAVDYSEDLAAEELPSTTKIRDFVSAVEFYDSTELLRSSVYVFSNAQQLDLEEWVEDHDSAFFRGEVENIDIAGHTALLRRINFQGVSSPLAYVDLDGLVVSIKGLMDGDFESIAQSIRFEL